MRMKKMLAILATLSVLGTTGLTVGAEDVTTTEPATETVTTETEAVTTAAVAELEQVSTEETKGTDTPTVGADDAEQTTGTEGTTPTETQTEVATTTVTETNGTDNSTTASVTTATEETETTTTTTTESAEETAKIMEELQDQLGELMEEVYSGSNPDLTPENATLLEDFGSDNVMQFEDGTWVATYHTYYVDEDGDVFQVVYYVTTDGAKGVLYYAYTDDFDEDMNFIGDNNPIFDEFYVKFDTFYQTLTGTKEYYVVYCETPDDVHSVMYVAVEMEDGSIVCYAVSEDGIQVVDSIPGFDDGKSDDSPIPTATMQKSTDSTPKTGDTTTVPAVAVGLTLTAAGVVAFLNRKYK